MIYLSDHSGAMYVNGLASVGPGYGSMIGMLREQLESLTPTDLYVMATSAGGFVGLRTAIDLQADAFTGMSIRSDLSPSSPIMTLPFERYVLKVCKDPEMLVNLRPLVEASDFPRRIQLYTGDALKIDLDHTENLRGIPRVKITYLDAHYRHDVVGGLIARGLFAGVLRHLIGESDEPLPLRGHARPSTPEPQE